MDDQELSARLTLHMAQHHVAVFAQWCCGIAGGIAAMWHGKPALFLLGVLGVGFFHLAKPGSDPDIDRALSVRDKEGRT